MAKWKLLGKRLLVQEILRPTFEGGIHLPDYRMHDRPREFRVIAIGTKPVDARPGDRVICHSHFTGPQELGNNLYIITEEEVLAILPAPATGPVSSTH